MLKKYNFSAPTIYAILNKHTDVAITLIQEGAQLDQKNKLGKSACFYAIQRSDNHILEILLEHGARISEIAHTNYMVLECVYDLAMAGSSLDKIHPDDAQKLIHIYNEINSSFFPLCPDFIHLLVQRKPNLHFLTQNQKNTLLLFSSGKGSVETIQFLIENGADPSAQKSAPLYPAYILNNEALIPFLDENYPKAREEFYKTLTADTIYKCQNIDFLCTYIKQTTTPLRPSAQMTQLFQTTPFSIEMNNTHSIMLQDSSDLITSSTPQLKDYCIEDKPLIDTIKNIIEHIDEIFENEEQKRALLLLTKKLHFPFLTRALAKKITPDDFEKRVPMYDAIDFFTSFSNVKINPQHYKRFRDIEIPDDVKKQAQTLTTNDFEPLFEKIKGRLPKNASRQLSLFFSKIKKGMTTQDTSNAVQQRRAFQYKTAYNNLCIIGAILNESLQKDTEENAQNSIECTLLHFIESARFCEQAYIDATETELYRLLKKLPTNTISLQEQLDNSLALKRASIVEYASPSIQEISSYLQGQMETPIGAHRHFTQGVKLQHGKRLSLPGNTSAQKTRDPYYFSYRFSRNPILRAQIRKLLHLSSTKIDQAIRPSYIVQEAYDLLTDKDAHNPFREKYLLFVKEHFFPDWFRSSSKEGLSLIEEEAKETFDVSYTFRQKRSPSLPNKETLWQQEKGAHIESTAFDHFQEEVVGNPEKGFSLSLLSRVLHKMEYLS